MQADQRLTVYEWVPGAFGPAIRHRVPVHTMSTSISCNVTAGSKPMLHFIFGHSREGTAIPYQESRRGRASRGP
jgi:hypothetical protein